MMFGLGKLAAVAATVIGIAAGSASAYAADKDMSTPQSPPVSSRRWLRHSLPQVSWIP